MKRIISIILVAAVIIMSAMPAIAAGNKCNCGNDPIIFVYGFGSSLYLNNETGESECVYPTQTNAILNAVPDLIKGIGSLAILKSNECFVGNISSVLDDMMGKLACDKNGNSIFDISPEPSLSDSSELHLNKLNETDENIDLIDGKYVFYYDWRLDPFENAKELKKYIEEIKKLTNHDKVILSSHSQGTTIVTTYLYTYGSDNISKAVFLSPAYKGISLIGSVFTRNVTLSEKEYAIEEFVRSLLGTEDYGKLTIGLLSVLNGFGMTTSLFNFIQSILDDNLDAIYDECLIELFATMPGIWSFVPDEYYQQAKESMFGDGTGYKSLIKRIDKYHYNVQNNVDQILSKTKKSGVDIAIILGYDISSIPVTESEAKQSDMLIDTELMSLGAICSSVGSSFEADYKQAKNKCKHNHLSSDKKIDASSCAFPEYTWFVKGQAHNAFPNGYVNFFNWVLKYNGQPTVRTNEKYPQFITNNEQGKIIPVTDLDAPETQGGIMIILDAIAQIFKNPSKVTE